MCLKVDVLLAEGPFLVSFCIHFRRCSVMTPWCRTFSQALLDWLYGAHGGCGHSRSHIGAGNWGGNYGIHEYAIHSVFVSFSLEPTDSHGAIAIPVSRSLFSHVM